MADKNILDFKTKAVVATFVLLPCLVGVFVSGLSPLQVLHMTIALNIHSFSE